jgi:hypothetical protein
MVMGALDLKGVNEGLASEEGPEETRRDGGRGWGRF